jgi:hypothetical protein
VTGRPGDPGLGTGPSPDRLGHPVLALTTAVRAGPFDDRIDEPAAAFGPDIRYERAVSNPPYLEIE